MKAPTKVTVRRKKGNEQRREFWNFVAERMVIEMLPEDRQWLFTQRERYGNIPDDNSALKEFIQKKLAEAKLLKEKIARKCFLSLWDSLAEELDNISTDIAKEHKSAKNGKKGCKPDQEIIEKHLVGKRGHLPQKRMKGSDDIDDQVLQSPLLTQVSGLMDHRLMASLEKFRDLQFISDKQLAVQTAFDDDNRSQMPLTPQSSTRKKRVVERVADFRTPKSARRLCATDGKALNESGISSVHETKSGVIDESMEYDEETVARELAGFAESEVMSTSTPKKVMRKQESVLNVADQEMEQKKPTHLIPCDDSCYLPEHWALAVYKKLLVLTNPYKDGFEKQTAFVELEACDSCLLFQYPNCELGEGCEDLLKLLRIAAPHSSGMRNLLRRYYRMRQLNNWMLQLDLIFEAGSLLSLLKHIDTSEERRMELSFDRVALPRPIREQVQSSHEIYRTFDANDIASVNKVETDWGKHIKGFREKLFDYPQQVCDVCYQWVEKVNQIKGFDKLPIKRGYENNIECMRNRLGGKEVISVCKNTTSFKNPVGIICKLVIYQRLLWKMDWKYTIYQKNLKI